MAAVAYESRWLTYPWSIGPKSAYPLLGPMHSTDRLGSFLEP
jgi:hypothetical protein